MKTRAFIFALAALLLCVGAAEENVLVLPDDTKVIEAEAFCDAVNVGKVVLPEGVQEIQSRAFAGCTLSEINLPQSLTSIADDAFAGCEGVRFTTIEDSYAYEWAVENGYISFETVVEAGLTFLVGPHSAQVTDCAADAVEITVPTSIHSVPVTGIAEYAFEYCESLEKVTLPDSIVRIGSFAFHECAALAEIEIPVGVSELPGSAFRECRSLCEITLHEGLQSIGYMCFENCWELTSIVLPVGFVEIGIKAFSNCQGLEEVVLPESLTTIGDGAFYYCTAIDRLVIPKAVRSIGGNAFYGCNLTAVVDAGTFPDGSYASRYCSLNGVPYETY